MDKKRVVVVGGSFGGINAAYELRRRLLRNAEITVISRDAAFTFMPSLLWVIMGWRDPSRLQVPLDGPLQRRRIRFVQGEVKELDPHRGEVRTSSASFPYDALILCPGAELDHAAVPAIDPMSGYVHSTFTVDEAVRARNAWRKYWRRIRDAW